ncbi:MAG: beta-ketoacyl-[acyl-carrier-protein] synthase family protein, partial [Planctomycetota bacterium]|nr:beta-ketoacyl-[acyl-carrier-protein] synthase family protein [Planctomycetota bacterium]
MSRVVITGVGLVTGLGTDRESTWSRLLAGQRAPRRISAGVIGAPACERLSESEPSPSVWDDPVVRLALQAAAECVADAGRPDEVYPRERSGCVVGTSKGGLASAARWLATPDSCGDMSFSDLFPHAAAQRITRRYRLRGPCLAPVAACATGLVCLIRAAELLRDGVCDVVLAGSADASLLPIVLGSFRRLGVLARATEDPADACRPFDRERSGFVVGEGAAIFCLEHEHSARARGANIYGEWVAGTLASDPSGLMHLDPAGESLTWLIRETLRRGGLSPAKLDYLNLHGTATQQNDLCETGAIHAALNHDAMRVACSSQKGSLGHLLGAAGSVETALTLLALRDQIVPPTMNLTH